MLRLRSVYDPLSRRTLKISDSLAKTPEGKSMTVVKYVVAAVLSLSLIATQTVAVSGPKGQRGAIEGRIVDAETKEILVGSSVAIVGGLTGTRSNVEGDFSLSKLAPETYSLNISHVGYESREYDDLVVNAGETMHLDVELTPKPISVKNIVVSPSRFAIMETTPSVQQSLSRKDIESMPQFGEDIYRAVRRLPGTSSNDYSAKFTVRGGQHDEVLVLLDGMELYEPLHLKDIDGGALSIIDVAAIEGIDLMTGGFTAPYGDRMSGVFDIKSKRPPVNERKYSVGISFMNARAMSHGSFAENKGLWLFSARRGYLDLIMDMVDPESNFRPKYYDVFGKGQYQLSPSHVLSAHILHAGDDLFLVDDENGEQDTVETGYDNSYIWLTLHSALKPQLTVRTIASLGIVSNLREASSTFSDTTFDASASDEREFSFVGLKQDWEYELSDRVFIKAGFEFAVSMPRTTITRRRTTSMNPKQSRSSGALIPRSRAWSHRENASAAIWPTDSGCSHS
jgi:hypothetical protein